MERKAPGELHDSAAPVKACSLWDDRAYLESAIESPLRFAVRSSVESINPCLTRPLRDAKILSLRIQFIGHRMARSMEGARDVQAADHAQQDNRGRGGFVSRCAKVRCRLGCIIGNN